MSEGDRRAALEMQALGKQDREWILGRLGQQERARIEPLLSELDALDIRFDLDPAQLAGEPAAVAALPRELPPPAPQAAAVLRRASAAAVMRALEREPRWLVDSVLAADSWPWTAAVRAAQAGQGGQGPGIRPRERPAAARGPALDSALIELLAARLQAPAPIPALNGYRNGHDHAHDPRSRWSKMVSGVRQWLP